MLLSFDAFRNNALLEILAMSIMALTMEESSGVSGDLADKGFVDLQDIDGKLAKIAEAGIAGAKVIHSNVYSQWLKRMKFGTADKSACAIRTLSVSSRSR